MLIAQTSACKPQGKCRLADCIHIHINSKSLGVLPN